MTWDSWLLMVLNHDLAHPALDVLLAGLTLITTPGPLILALTVLAWRRPRQGRPLMGAFVAATLLAVGLQFLLGRPRPSGVRLILTSPAFPSFPSGHAAGAFSLAALVALLWPHRRWPALLAPTLISLSRVYLGHHYPTDVLGGAILGAATGAVVYGLFCQSDLPPTSSVAGEGEPPSESSTARMAGNPDRVTRYPRPLWAWLLWGQLAVVLLATLAASLDLLRLGFLALPGADKALHFLLYGLLSFLAVAWWARQPAWRVVLVLGLLALAEEMSQALIPGRSPDALDLAAALAGVVLAGWLGARLRMRSEG